MIDIDCRDNSCLFAKKKGGMRTNGGCRCFHNAGFAESATMAARQLLELRDRVKQLEEQLNPKPLVYGNKV